MKYIHILLLICALLVPSFSTVILKASDNNPMANTYLYPDGSVMLEVTSNETGSGLSNSFINASIQATNGHVLINANGLVKNMESIPVQGTYIDLNGYTININLNTEKTTSGFTSTLNINAESSNEHYSITVKADENKETLFATLTINAHLILSKEDAGYIKQYLSLTPDQINMLIKNQGIDWLTVKSFKGNIENGTNNTIKVSLNGLINIDGMKALEEYNMSVSDIKSMLESSIYLSTLSLKYTEISHTATFNLHAVVNGNINDILKYVVNSGNITFYALGELHNEIIPPLTEGEHPDKIISDLLKNFTEKFEIIPSTFRIFVSWKSDIPDYKIETFMVKEKGTTDPIRTIRDLVKLLMNTEGTTLEWKEHHMSNMTVNIIPENGLKIVNSEGSPVKQAKLIELQFIPLKAIRRTLTETNANTSTNMNNMNHSANNPKPINFHENSEYIIELGASQDSHSRAMNQFFSQNYGDAFAFCDASTMPLCVDAIKLWLKNAGFSGQMPQTIVEKYGKYILAINIGENEDKIFWDNLLMLEPTEKIPVYENGIVIAVIKLPYNKQASLIKNITALYNESVIEHSITSFTSTSKAMSSNEGSTIHTTSTIQGSTNAETNRENLSKSTKQGSTKLSTYGIATILISIVTLLALILLKKK